MMRGAAFLIASGLLALASASATAQSYPVKPIRLIAPSSPGSAVDMIARIVGQKLGEQLGQQVLVDNRAGAGGNLGAEIAAKAPADGYTLFMVTSTFAINVSLYPKLSYDLQRDFAPVSLLLGNGSLVLVAHPSFPAKTVKELIALAKASPVKSTTRPRAPATRCILRESCSSRVRRSISSTCRTRVAARR